MNGIRTFHDRDGTARLVCFPHAGGNARAFSALSAALPDDIEVHVVQYPGRHERRGEPCAEGIEDLAAEAAAALAGYDDRPLFLLGQSMGALVAFETARRLRGRAAVTRLFASAARPPSEDWGEPDLDALADERIVGELRRLGGVPEPVLNEPELVDEALRQLRSDVRALRRYRCADGAAVAAPLTVVVGSGDPKNSVSQMRDWAQHTTGGHVVETLQGGHFALTERTAEAAALLTRYVRADIGEPAVDGERTGGAAPADLVREILVAGVDGRRPPLSTDLTALEEAARTKLAPDAFAYVAGTAGSGDTGRANRAAFARRRLVPRMLRGAVHRDLTVRLAGQLLPAPVLLAPVAAQTVVHPEGELATARAAAEVGLPFVLSTFSGHSLEEVAGQSGRTPRWFQLYLPSDRAVAESLVRRAESGGYTALVVTVDASYLGFRPMELDNAYSPFLRGAGIANFTTDPAFRAGLPDGADPVAMVRRWAEISIDPAIRWDALAWLLELTDLPVFVKGILHPDDARMAVECGAHGLVVSNHGGRQLDGSTAALDALPAVRTAVAGRVPVLLDSGVRSGTDVVKALALGADAVLVGRPYVYGLGLSGQRGVEHVLRCLLADLDLALALTGCASLADITPDLITDERFRPSLAK
ncbi:alpha-hydroxy-acid oxidizing protein [Streptomyces avermitilis]|uniref:alpha-hydroxy-acid oxidizing protein n=1 Tax=Streptomyces avermitilis TaxID=33903 RepID=UPI003401C47D